MYWQIFLCISLTEKIQIGSGNGPMAQGNTDQTALLHNWGENGLSNGRVITYSVMCGMKLLIHS